MASYDIAFEITAGNNEGGYSNNPKDRGGETYKGISRKNYPSWPGWKSIDESKKLNGFPAILAHDEYLEQRIKDFYKGEFWHPLGLDNVVNQSIANELFDTAVNCGTGVAALFLQRSLNVANLNGKYYADLKVDGDIGPVTIKALNSHPKPKNILKLLNCLQGAKYISICEANPVQEVFLNGWIEHRVA